MIQRGIEIAVVEKKLKDSSFMAPDKVEFILIACCLLQVLMEVGLFSYLICTLCKIDNFLKSFQSIDLS